jgi:hypothetical protein
MPRRMSGLGVDFLLLKNPPQTEGQKQFAKSLGFRQVRSGKWVRPDVPTSPSLGMLQEHGPGHTCKACRGFFRSKTQREQYCPSCRGIIDLTAKELTAILHSAFQGSFDQARLAKAAVEEGLTCTFPTGPRTHCGWQVPMKSAAGLSLMIKSVARWATKAHCHHMRHVYWNRFPYSKKFFPYVASRKEREELYRHYYSSKWHRKLDRLLGTPAIEIPYPEEQH